MREQLAGWKQRLAGHDDVIAQIDTLTAKLDEVEDPLILPGEQKDTLRPQREDAAQRRADLLIALSAAPMRFHQAKGELTAELLRPN